jgi:CheY-like chemotaxis protein
VADDPPYDGLFRPGSSGGGAAEYRAALAEGGVTIAPTPRTTAPSILVIEDNGEVRRSVIDLLELHDFHVVAASNGIQALRALEQGTLPDVILLDLELPFMSGWQLLRDLAASPSRTNIPVVIMSAHEIGKSGLSGAAAVLQKPLWPGILLQTLHACLPGAGRRPA